MKRDLAALCGREHDLLVVGGGIYGAAAAWEAASRGLSVGLVEREDFGAGASWNSLKTVHGGLRYLQALDLPRMRESIRERRALLRIAPEVVRPLPFLVPTYGHGLRGPEAVGMALLLNDLVSHDRNRGLPETHRIPRGRRLSRRDVLARVPGLPERTGPGRLNGGGMWFDAQADSTERLTVAFVHAAAGAGALVANHAEVVALIQEGRRVRGVRGRDALSGRPLEVRARLVLNAAGPGGAPLLAGVGVARPPVPFVRAWNLVFERRPPAPLAVGALSQGRFLFLVPWRDCTLVGTAYGPIDAPAAASVAAFRREAEAAFPWAGLQTAGLALVHEGVVPGTGDAAGLSARPRLVDHEAEDGVAGLVSVQGVKYTTARGVAERTIGLVLRRLGRAGGPSRSAVTPLPRARPLAGPLEARTREAMDEEMALTLADAVLRRLDLGTAGPPAEADLAAVARTMREALGWDAAREEAERAALAKRYPAA